MSLFISRRIKTTIYTSYGVVDTDDGVETKLPGEDIYNIINQSHLEILGVNPETFEITVYQLPELVTRRQTKARLMQAVDIKIWNGMITSVKWDAERITKPVHVRLSDYASKCADLIFSENHDTPDSVKVVIILDDKLTWYKTIFEFYWAAYVGVAFDFRELSDIKAQYAYDCMYEIFSEIPRQLMPSLPTVIDSRRRVYRLNLPCDTSRYIRVVESI